MKKILITGGAGFIGSNLALKLLSSGYTVSVLDNLSPQIHGVEPEKTSPLYQMIFGKVRFIKGSVTSKDDWLKAIKGQDVVVHLAAETGTGQSMYEIKRYCDVNVVGIALLLDILVNKNHTIKKIVLASSRAIYGEGKYECAEHGVVYPEARIHQDMKKADFECKCPICGNQVNLLPTSEDSKIHPTSIYGITKQNQEQMILTVGKTIGIPTVVFRYQNVYGPGQSLSNPYTGILSIFSSQIKNGNNLNIFEDGKESRDFVYIDDVVNATMLGLENDQANYEVFNVGANKPINITTVAKTLIEIYNTSIEYEVTEDYRIGDIRHNFADLNKIKKLLGYKPKYTFNKGIALFCDWVNSQDVQEDNYLQSIVELKQRKIMN